MSQIAKKITARGNLIPLLQSFDMILFFFLASSALVSALPLEAKSVIGLALPMTNSATATTLTDKRSSLPNYDWDLAIAHGGYFSLVTFDNTNSSAISINELFVPFPANATSSILRDLNADVKEANYQTYGQISFLASDSQRNLLFYSHEYTIPTSSRPSGSVLSFHDLNVYNFATNESKQLFQSTKNNATYDDIIYHKNSLYWIDSISQCIMALELPDPKILSADNKLAFDVSEPTVLVNLTQLRATSFNGLAMDPDSGFIYWGVWRSIISSEFAIQYYNGESITTLLTKNITLPSSLIITPDSHLYWINKQRSGSQYTIERVKLDLAKGENGHNSVDASNRQQIYTGQSHNLFSFIVPCRSGQTLLVTDTKSQSLIKINTTSGKSTLLKYYKKSLPHGMVMRTETWFGSNSLCSDEIEETVNTTAVIPNNSSSSTKSTPTKLPLVKVQSATSMMTKPSTTYANSIINKKNRIMGPNISKKFELYSCDNHCSNGGTCLALNQDDGFCLCLPGWVGATCQIKWPLTADDSNITALTYSSNNKVEQPDSSQTTYYSAVIISLGIILCVLLLVIGALVVKIYLLSRKPKIHRRVIVSRAARAPDSNGVGGGIGNNVCELIDIENCCNMNICETPCYETGLLMGRNPTGSSSSSTSGDSIKSGADSSKSCDKKVKREKKSSGGGKDDKQRLIQNV